MRAGFTGFFLPKIKRKITELMENLRQNLEKCKYLIALSCFPKFGPARMRRIKKYFPDWETAFLSETQELIKSGLEENIANEFKIFRLSQNPEKIIAELERENVWVMPLTDEIYPASLKEIYNPPPLLYCRGKIKEEDKLSLAIVGTRKFTSYGRQAAEQIAAGLALNKLTVVSGLAMGIDALAHEAALRNSGRTIAVLGSGLDKRSIYPSANRYLAEKITAAEGAVISEFPLGTPPLRHHFPQRNRLISGLSLGTLVIEAGEKSGALITAKFALEQNREVFAVPGSIYSPASLGPNNLIKEGARAVLKVEDILETLDLKSITNYIDNKKIIPATAEEEKILACLSFEPLHIDEIIRQSGLPPSATGSTLTLMEMKGMAKNLGGMKYVLTR